MINRCKISFLLVLIVITGCASARTASSEEQWSPVYIAIEHRKDPVDIAAPYFESLGRTDSSVVNGAWFDSGNQYLVISLQGTVYHYCGIGSSIWDSLKSADSMGSYFGDYIKGNFDCRIFPVPVYP